MVILRWKGLILVRRDLVTAVLTTIDTGVSYHRPRGMFFIKFSVIILMQVLTMFVLSHDSPFLPES